MKTRIKMLKVKIKSLAAEAGDIRLEEQRAKGRRGAKARRRNMGRGFVECDPAYLVFKGRDDVLRDELYRHRLDVVRPEQRASLLAYAFLRGRPLAAVEPKCLPGNEPDWKRVGQLVLKFGPVDPTEAEKAAQAAALVGWRNPAVTA